MTMAAPAILKVVRKATKKTKNIKEKHFNEEDGDYQSINEDEGDYSKDFKRAYDFDEDRMGDDDDEDSSSLRSTTEKRTSLSSNEGFGDNDCVNEIEYNNGSYGLRCVRPSAENANDIDNAIDDHLTRSSIDDDDEDTQDHNDDNLDVADFKDGPSGNMFLYANDHGHSEVSFEDEEGNETSSFCSEDGIDDNDYNYIDDC
jgi:hypothetical protein